MGRFYDFLIVALLLIFFPPPSFPYIKKPPSCLWTEEETLFCNVSPGHYLIPEEEIDKIGPENAKRLTVECVNSNSNYEHLLSHGVFYATQNLRELALINCRIKGITPGSFSYLTNLKNLTIKANTSHSTSLLELKRGVLCLPHLNTIDISTTSLALLPHDFFCCLPNLTFLNLSDTSLKNLQFLQHHQPHQGHQHQHHHESLSTTTNPCKNKISSFDLSSNLLKKIPPAAFANFPHLIELKINYNLITIISERAFMNLSHLQIISLNDNKIQHLPPELFKNCQYLRDISFRNNSLKVIGPGIFGGLNRLIYLDLSLNELSSEWISGNIFWGLKSLIYLNLSRNKLVKVENSLFKDLESAQQINLEYNRISEIQENAFKGLNLKALLLSNNRIKTLSSITICTHFFSLENNLLEEIENEAFGNCSDSIQDLNLSGNKIKNIENLKNLKSLRTLDLGENLLENFTAGNFEGLNNLYGLRVTGNFINKIEKDSFAHLKNIKFLNFSKNNISVVEEGAFDLLQNLQALRLDQNTLKEISQIISQIDSLILFNISGNLLKNLDYSQLPKNLQLLDASNNEIKELTNSQVSKIRKLNISKNKLKELNLEYIPDSIENLLLSENQIDTLAPFIFYKKANLSFIDLSANNLSTSLDINSLRMHPSNNNSILLLKENPLVCSCHLSWLGKGYTELFGIYPVIADIQDVECILPFKSIRKSILEVKEEEFLCECKENCPEGCMCMCKGGEVSNSFSLVDCSRKANKSLEIVQQIEATTLYLDGNDFQVLESYAFSGKNTLKYLYLNASKIEYIQNRTFYGLTNLITLQMANNYLDKLYGHEFKDLKNIEHLNLEYNSISWINEETFSHLYKMETLLLNGNNLFDFPIWASGINLLLAQHALAKIFLAENEWSCQCEFTDIMKQWIGDFSNKIPDLDQLNCVQLNANRTGIKILKLLDNPPCEITEYNPPLQTLLPQQEDFVQENVLVEEEEDEEESSYSSILLLVLGVVGLLIAIAIVILCILVYLWRKSLAIWIFWKFGTRIPGFSRENSKEDRLFDAFVSFSEKDESWVRTVLSPELKEYRLCLKSDLPPGNTIDTIVQASEASRRILIVLSSHFLREEWSKVEVKVGHHALLKERDRKVIIVILGQIDPRDLDQDIRLYLKNFEVIEAESKRFLAKLKFAFPDVRGRDKGRKGQQTV